MSTEHEMKEALLYAADQIEAYADRDHRLDIARFCREMAAGGRPGFRQFLKDRDAPNAA